VIRKNAKHFWKPDMTYRYYKEDKNNPFYFPYMLVSGAHNYKEKEYRELIDFPRSDDGLFFGDSGGYQILTGKVSKDYSVKKAFDWLENNCDIFPLLDRPFPKNFIAMTKEEFTTSLEFTRKNAKYYLDNRTNSDTTILNVIQGRDLYEIDAWYQGMKEYKFEGWAFGGYNLTQILACFFYLFEKGEMDNCRLFHIFMMTKMKYIPFLTYLQNLIHKDGYNTFISYDSSYQIIQTAFGRMALYPTLTGQKWIKYSNKNDYSKLTNENLVPCDCPYCKDVPLKELIQFTSERYYSTAVAHNILKFVEFKKMIERIIHVDILEVIEELFSVSDMKVFKIINNAWKNRYKKGNYKKIYEELRPFVANELKKEGSKHTSDKFKGLF